MKRIVFVFACLISLLSFSNAEASNYRIDDTKLDALFSSAISTAMVNVNDISNELPGMGTEFAPAVKEKSPVAALVLDFFLGPLGIHRFYLGTKTMTGIGYILTCGGIFGLVPFVDLIVLAVNFDDISQFVDNPKFFMW